MGEWIIECIQIHVVRFPIIGLNNLLDMLAFPGQDAEYNSNENKRHQRFFRTGWIRAMLRLQYLVDII